MKQKTKIFVSLSMALIMIVMSVPFAMLNVQALGSIKYSLNADKKSYCVSDCDDNYFGRAKISSTYEGLPVTKIAKNAFDNSDIYEVIIPDSITEIGEYAFSGCDKLRRIKFSNSVIEIKPYAFTMCTRLRELSFPESLKKIGDYAFSGCDVLKDIYFLGNKTEISVYSDIGQVSGATIYGYFSSTAEKYAANSNIDFESIVCDETVIHKPQSTADGIVLTWDKVKGASSYRVYRKTDKDKSWTLLGTVKRTKYVDENVSAGQKFIYTVKACNAYVDGEYNKAGVDAKYLTTPVLTSVSADKNGVTVKWDAVSGADKYDIYHKTCFGDWVKAGSTSDTSFVDKTVKKGKRYTYRVVALASVYGTTVESSNSKGLKVTVSNIATPAIESVCVTSYNEITVTWNANEGAEYYLVYRSTKADSGFKNIAKVETNSYKDTSIQFDKKYYYKVVTVDGEESEASPAKSKTARVPAPVISKNISATSSKVDLTWGKVSGASGYYVYRYDNSAKKWVKIATLRGNASTAYTDKKTGENKYKISAFRTVNKKDYAGDYSSVLTTTTFSKPTLTVKQYGSGFVNEVTWTSVSKATGYQIYYKVGENGSWTRAASVSSRITSYKMDVTNGKYYYWKVRPVFEKDGFVTTGSYSNTDDVMIYYTPSIRVSVSNVKVENAKTVTVTIENKGVCPLRVLKNGAYIYNGANKSDCNGTITLVDDNTKKIDYKDIAPGKTAKITFLIDGPKKGYYDANTLIQFYFNYDSMKYILQTDPGLAGSNARYQLV